MAVQIVRGGSTGKSFHFGPGCWKKGYPTVANGWADSIEAGPGDVIAYLRAQAARAEAPATRRLAVLAAEIEEASTPDSTPLGRLAHALDLDVSRLAEAAHLAKVSITLIAPSP
jgi:hypothetical protein